jgi:hypothetical protein
MLRYVADILKRMKMNEATGSAEFRDQVDHDIDVLPNLRHKLEDDIPEPHSGGTSGGRLSKDSVRRTIVEEKHMQIQDDSDRSGANNVQQMSSPQILVVRQLWLWRLDESNVSFLKALSAD